MTPLRLTEGQFARLQRGEPIGAARKFGNEPTTVAGIAFDSAHEARHYRTLLLRQRAGDLRKLERQIAFPLVVAGVQVGVYKADFVYEERARHVGVLPECEGTTWVQRIVDAKSPATRLTAVYRLKKKIMAALGFEIVEVLAPRRRRKTAQRRR